MKKLFYVFVLLAGSVSLYAAETVSSVSFNPSRMGDYTYLKVANKATLKGGLKTPEMNISVGGTISAEYSPNDSSRVYVINQLMGNPTSAIDMEQAVFHGNIAAQYTGYKSESSLLPAGLLPLMTIYGGNQTYLNDSYIQTLDAVNMLRQRAGELKSTSLSVLGSGGGTASLYNGGSTYGLHLAGNDIPEPTGSHTNTGKDLSNCTLVWEKRKTSTTPAKEVWLLALKDCTESGMGSVTSPESKEYYWALTDSGSMGLISSGSAPFPCSSNCIAGSSSGSSASSVPPSSLPANALSPTCDSSHVGYTCNTGTRLVATTGGYTQYCPTYTCQVKL